MKTLTLRGIDEELAGELERLSKHRRESMNAAILRLLRESTGIAKTKFRELHDDLDDLAGSWTEEERREFEEVTAAFSRVDEDVWR